MLDHTGDHGIKSGVAHGSFNAAAAMNKPKELGILQRADGLRSGLRMLRTKFEAFSDRLDGNASAEGAAKGSEPQSTSLAGTFSDAENDLRICLQMIDTLNARF